MQFGGTGHLTEDGLLIVFLQDSGIESRRSRLSHSVFINGGGINVGTIDRDFFLYGLGRRESL